MKVHAYPVVLALLALAGVPALASAQCRDSVVLIHGNTGGPDDFDNTVDELHARGYDDTQIFAPDWGSKSCAACNDHNGSEETPVENALIDAIASSCTGKVDVITHSMGGTLGARVIKRVGLRSYIDSYVAIAGGFRGLWSCGTYPYNVWNSTCGSWGLSVSSPFLDDLYGFRFADKVYSIKSWTDQIVCSTGYCTVGGIHSSSIWGEDGSYTYNGFGHFGLLSYTATTQVDLIQ
ncbi:alpha/beta fold hydrolase [Marilutibacter maris]|nr:alpha/beta fold hydrolase [Lysobacter maris]